MRIAIIGAGSVGGGLGAALVSVGHTVVFGVRDPDSDRCRAALMAVPGPTAARPAAAVANAHVVAFALRWDAVPGTIAQLPSLEGRVVIDAMNRVRRRPGQEYESGPRGVPPRSAHCQGFQHDRLREPDHCPPATCTGRHVRCRRRLRRQAHSPRPRGRARVPRRGRWPAFQREAARGDGEDLAGTHQAPQSDGRLRDLGRLTVAL